MASLPAPGEAPPAGVGGGKRLSTVTGDLRGSSSTRAQGVLGAGGALPTREELESFFDVLHPGEKAPVDLDLDVVTVDIHSRFRDSCANLLADWDLLLVRVGIIDFAANALRLMGSSPEALSAATSLVLRALKESGADTLTVNNVIESGVPLLACHAALAHAHHHGRQSVLLR